MGTSGSISAGSIRVADARAGKSAYAPVLPEEQLGPKLDAQRGPVDVLVIDRVERPTED